MPTDKQKLGDFGENLVAKSCSCPKCKRSKTLKKLPPNFKCADLICDFCGYLAQVKTANVGDVEKLPLKILGAAWGPQKERMDAAIYFPLFLVLSEKEGSAAAIYYLPSDLQSPELFKPRKPLSENARRAGWQGFIYDISAIQSHFVRLV
ncbi:hypothetical protein GRI34_02875 [Erythrobacter aquimaris]|uniref:Uncharacterized protein n=1 Tax=Qipengyuania aquimaris TaxID=255984 RepID=A0A6I4TLD5_9SPHN|nr:DpnI domain-containing protein [Qipengyuania aquimaris]MXO95363.1 hypothetical protein [Qipengyuania aquimaris]